ncbi:START-like domain [Phytophthora cactorum]|nr:START-like domain [Phytophthora cactorum]
MRCHSSQNPHHQHSHSRNSPPPKQPLPLPSYLYHHELPVRVRRNTSDGGTSQARGAAYPTANDVDFEAYGKESIQILLNRHTGDDKVTTWEVVDDADGVQIWRGAVEECDWCPFRARRRIDADKRVIEQVLLDPNRTLELDEMMEGIVTLRDIGESNHLAFRQITSKGQFPIMAWPPRGLRAAHNYISGYIIEEFKEDNGNVYCVVTLLAHADLAGYIPPSIINMLGTSSTVKVLESLETIVTAK